MSYYRTCPRCGAHLDPGERCTCAEEGEKKAPSLCSNTETARRNRF